MSARSLSVVLTLPAERDFANLLAFAEQQWGREQRRRYKAKLDRALGELASFPDLGRPRGRDGLDQRGFRVGEHVIYYRHDSRTITILRILHHRMNPEQHLPGR